MSVPREYPRGIKLVATDLDGTLLHSDGSVSDRSRAALKAAADAGLLVVFVTGRPPRWMDEIADATGMRGLAVCANGALVYDLGERRVVAERLIDPSTLDDVTTRLRDAIPDVTFAVEYGEEFLHEDVYRPRWDAGQPGTRRTDDPTQLVSDPAAKLLARHEDLDPDTLLRTAREVVGSLVELTHSSPGSGLLEISATGVSKASTLAALCAQRGFGPEDVIAFGDMPNDLPLLAWAGTPYAMANAHPSVLAAVERRAPDVEDDGVAVVLEGIYPA
jgi:Cof subfamily protein (haloacid dehalogenase superfamily)